MVKHPLLFLMLCCFGFISAQTYQIGDLYTAPDGSRGIVYYLHPDGSGGWVVALNDASSGCAWGDANDVPGLTNQSPSYYQQLLNDTAGYANTQTLRNYQNNSTTYAAGKVDFTHGWVLPSPAQLSMLYGQLPFIASAITGAGGTALAYDWYWCSGERDASNAWRVTFGYSDYSGYFNYATKTTNCRVRAVRSFSNTAVVYDTALTYQWNTGSTQPYLNASPSQTTTYTVTGTTEFGCSNTAEQTIIVGTGVAQTIYDTVCQGAGYEANGFTLMEAETGTAGTLTRSRTLTTAGCSSTLTLQLKVNEAVAELVEATACGSYTWNGITYYESGNYTQTFTAANGCDSIVTLHLTIHHGTHNAVTETVCDSYEWHDSAYTTSGVYTYEYTNADGCPSVDTLHLTVNYPVAELVEATACESYEWNGIAYTESGDYPQTFTAVNGCDSVVTLHLTIIPPPTLNHTPDTTILAGTSADLWASGADVLTWTNGEGEQLASGTMLTVSPETSVTYFIHSFNEAANMVYNGGFEDGNVGFSTDYVYGNTGSHDHYYVGYDIADMWPWDSPGFPVTDHTSGSGLFLMIDGSIQPNTTVWSQTIPVEPNTDYLFSAWFLTDNIAYFKYEINGVQTGIDYSTPETQWVWERYSQVWNSGPDTVAEVKIINRFSQSGGYDYCIDDISFTPLTDCSATDSIRVTVSYYETDERTICDSELPYVWNGVTFEHAGTEEVVLQASSGADSVVTLHLTVNHGTHNVETETACERYEWHGMTCDTSGTYTYEYTNGDGCPSVDTLHLVVIPLPEITLSPDTTIIFGASALLWASGADYYQWFPTDGLSDPNSATPLASPLQPTCYQVTGYAAPAEQDNVVVNGGFEAGYTGFTTDYNYVANPSQHNLGFGNFVINEDAHNVWPLQHQYGYGGDGLFMIVDGASTPNATVWSQTVNVQPNTSYDFSAQIVSLCASDISVARLQFVVNGVQLGPVFEAPSTLYQWVKFHDFWDSGNDTVATITILNQNTNGQGNDFGLDDIVFAPMPECFVTDSVCVSVIYNVVDTMTICESELPYEWNGVTFTQAGTQTTTLVAATGADSVVTMTLHVNALSYSNFDTAVVENALPCQYNDISYFESGIYTQNLTNAAGCDSILTLTLTVFPNVTTELDSTVCETALPLTWNDSIFTAAGTKTTTILATTGADSTVVMTLHVVALPVLTHSADTVIMPGASVNLWATGADIMAWTDADGNPLSSGGNLTVAPTVTTTYYITAFNEGNSVVTNGDFESGNAGFTTAYQYNSNLWPEGNYYVGTNAHNHHGNFPNWYDHTTGSGLYMIVNGATVAGTNLWTQTVPVIPHTSYAFSAWVCTLVGGYSSLARLQFSVNATQLGEIFHSPSSTSVWNRYYEVWYSGENTTATLTILNQNTTGGGNDFGVDDIQFNPLNFCNVTDSVTVYVSGQTDSTVCADALPLLWNGVEFTTAGTQTATITTPDGSDSVVVMTLHVNALSYNNFDTAVVENTLPLQYNGISYIEAGTYTQHLTNAAGCDSILTLTLAVFSNVTGEDDSTICASELPLLWNGVTFTQTGTQTATLAAATGADSVVTMTLHVNPLSYTTFDTAVVENALPLQYNEISYIEAGTYTQNFTNTLGCDSILTIHLTVYQNVTSTVDTTVCADDLPYTWHGYSFTAAGTHVVTLLTSHGADSTVTYHLSVDNISANIGNVTHITCYGESTGAATATVTGGQTPMTYAWTNASGTNIATTTSIGNRPAGTYTFTVTDHFGCTATASVTLNTLNGELQPGTIAASQEVCDGEDIAPFTGTAASGGNNGGYQWQTSTNGTDWTPAPGTNNAQGYTYPNTASSAFTLRRAWVSQSCGTVYSNTVTVSVWPNSSDTITASVCQGETYTEYDFDVTADQTVEAGIYTFEQHHATGHCDSAVILLLTVNPTVAELVEATVCEGEGYDANGFSVSPQETIGESVLTRVQNLQTVNGCDSVVTLQLTIIDTALRVEMLTDDFCEHNEASLTVLSPMSDYVWSTGETATTIVVTSPGIYSVTASEGGCSATAHIRVEGCHYELVLPNAITPSRGDGLNDCFYIPEGFTANINLFKVYIYNRWGELVFYSTDKNFRWYGECRGQTQYQTIYNYVIEYTDMAGRPQKRQGSITVL